jgi:hypothetical protein
MQLYVLEHYKSIQSGTYWAFAATVEQCYDI